MNKLRLVTVTGSRTDTLEYMINHYWDVVDELHIVVYDTKNNQYDNVKKITDKYKEKIFLYRHDDEQEYNWETVTALYNEVKSQYPNDWWVISDDDELHVYSKDIKDIIRDCNENGWQIVRGGFIDRIGIDGKFLEIEDYSKNKNLFSQFPYSGFFRYPMSKACPNKICIVKGSIEITPGQHYAKIDGHTTWRWQGWHHPLIAPVDEYNVQVHHFKWDKTVIDRIKKVADIRKDYAYSDEYFKMYQSLRNSNFQLNILSEDYEFEYCPVANFNSYKNWKKLFNKIISI
jgi:hypothetical protein